MQLFLIYPKEKKTFGYFLLFCASFWVHSFSCYSTFAQASLPTDKGYWAAYYKYKKAPITIRGAENIRKNTDNTYRFIKVNYISALQFDIRPLRVEKLPQKKLYGNYVKAGLGNYQYSYLEAFFNTRRSEKYSYGLHIKHANTGKGAVDGRNSADTQNQLLFNFQTTIKKGIILGNLGLNYQRWHFYGYPPTSKAPKAEDIQQNFGIFNAQINYTNKYRLSKYSYDVGLFYHYFMDYYAAKEQEIGISFASKVRFDVSNNLYFKAELSSSLRSDEAGSLRRDWRVGELYHQVSNDRFFLQIGGRAAVHNDTLRGMRMVHLYPKFNFSLNILKNRLDIYAQLEGDMQKRLLRNMLAENPYLAPNVALLHTNKAWESTIGLRTKLKSIFNWQASVSYGMYQYLHFFTNSLYSPAKFVVQYEVASVPLTTLKNEFTLNLKHFKAKIQTELQKYELQTLENAWHRPLLKNILSVSYIRNNLLVNIDFYHLAGITAFEMATSKPKDLPPITDLNIKIDYQLSPLWSLFVKGSNLLGQRYQRYLHYEVRATQLSGGASMTF